MLTPMSLFFRSNVLDKVMDGLYLGDSWEAGQKELLKEHKITHILPVGKGLQRAWESVSFFDCFYS